VVEQVIAWWERAMMVVVVAQGEILGSLEYVFGKKIGGSEKMGQEERIDTIFCYFLFFLSQTWPWADHGTNGACRISLLKFKDHIGLYIYIYIERERERK
jgi:hypothetical protein